MAKNNLTRLMSFLVVFSLLFSAFGCKNKEEIHSEIEQPSFENNTAVVKYTSVNAEGKEVVVSTVISRQGRPSDGDNEDSGNGNGNGVNIEGNVSVNNSNSNGGNNSGNNQTQSGGKTTTTTKKGGDSKTTTTKAHIAENIDAELAMGLTVNQMFRTEEAKQSFLKDINRTYKITPQKANEILEKGNDWRAFDYTFYVTNTTKKRIYVKEIKATNGNDIVINAEMDCEYSFGPGNGMSMNFNGLFNDKKYATDEDLIEALKGANVQIVYALIEVDQWDVDDWSKVETKTLPVEFE